MGIESKAKGSRCETGIGHLPDDIIISIFLKLPAETIPQLRYVCWCWFTLISSSYFIDTHLHFAESSCMIITRKNPTLSHLFVTEVVPHTVPISLRKFTTRKDVWDTCNGLVLFGDKRSARELYVANPATTKMLRLPPPTYGGVNQDRDFCMVYKSSSREYQVIHRFGRLFHSHFCDCEILTLGGETWEPVNVCNSLRDAHQHLENGITIKDVVHWLGRGPEIVSFDMTAKEFRKVKTPSCFHHWNAEGLLLEIDGCLSFVGHPSGTGRRSTMEIWSLKNSYRGEWVKIQAFDIERRVCMVAASGNGRIIIFRQFESEYKYTAYDTELKQTRAFGLPRGVTHFSFNARPHYESLVFPRYERPVSCSIEHQGKVESLRLRRVKKICDVVKSKMKKLLKLKKNLK